MKAVVERCSAQVMGCKPQTGRLTHPLLSKQALDLTLQSRNSTLATVSPVLKGLCLLEWSWRMAEFDHLHTTHNAFGREAISQEITSERRRLRLLSREWECSGEVRIFAKLFT
jgi:hypothetical protein